MAERLGYRHVSDFLREMTSAEFTGWLAYLQVDDEVKAQRTAYAIAKAFNGGKQQSKRVDEDEEVIDTTKSEFAEKFRGFTHAKPQQSRPNQRQTSTEVKIG